eukprot:1777817-Amphidinium_carterae.1
MEQTPKSVVREAIEHMAAKRHMPSRNQDGRRWPMFMVLGRGEQRRLSAAMRKFKHRSADMVEQTLPDVFVYTCQNADFNRSGSSVPALLRASRVWNARYQRLMLPSEHCAVMGIDAASLPSTLSDTQVKSLAGNAMH